VDFQDIFPGEWDRAIVIGPYQTAETLEATICEGWPGASTAADYVKADSGYIIVLMKGSAVLDWYSVNAESNPALGFDAPEPFEVEPANARFQLSAGPAGSVTATPQAALLVPEC
jgi:hypothetical protein